MEKRNANRLTDFTYNDQCLIVGRVANWWKTAWEFYPNAKEIAEQLGVQKMVVIDAMRMIADAYENMKTEANKEIG